MEQGAGAEAKDSAAHVTLIRPPRGPFRDLDFRELWHSRGMLGFLVWRDLKVRFRQTALGLGWVVLVPFVQIVIFTAIFKKGANLSTDGVPGPLFYACAVIPWSYFARALTGSSGSLVGNSNLLTKIYFPRLLLPSAPILGGLVDFSVAFTMLAALLAWYRVLPEPSAIFLPLLMLIAIGTAYGVGTFLAAVNVKYRDVPIITPFFIQLWMFCTVILPYSRVAEILGPYKWVYGLNPMAGVIEGFRWLLLGDRLSAPQTVETVLATHTIPDTLAAGQSIVVQRLTDGSTQLLMREVVSVPIEPPWMLIATGIPVTCVLLLFGIYYFKKTEHVFADVV